MISAQINYDYWPRSHQICQFNFLDFSANFFSSEEYNIEFDKVLGGKEQIGECIGWC